jgi:hypothetical protein
MRRPSNKEKIMRSIQRLVAAAAVALVASFPSFADTPGHHPAYLHALSDLRDARAHLEHFTNEPVIAEEDHAIEHIDKAIGEIKQAAIMDGKNIQDHMPVDTHLGRHDRFVKALELLDKAQHDAQGEEDQPDTQGLQLRVLRHIEEARKSVRHAIEVIHG